MKRLNVMMGDRRVGQLLADKGKHYFEYDLLFIREGLPISPFKLPVDRGVTEHSNGVFHSLPGVFSDSLPDRFGMSIIRQRFSELGSGSPTPLQMLAYLGKRTIGSLTYEPSAGDEDQQEAVDLVSAASSSRKLMKQDHGSELDAALVQAGQTAGGMMPKLLAAISHDCEKIVTGSDQIPDGMNAWLIKLNDSGAKTSTRCHMEDAYFKLARAAGLRVPETMMVRDSKGVEHFAIRRFDRDLEDPNFRIHLHTFSGLLEIDMADPSNDYDTLLRATARLTGNQVEIEEQFRRMLFNLLGSVRDDHAKNFSFQMDRGGEWTLSPAYDLGYSDNELGGNWLLIDGKRNGITYDDLYRMADNYSISRDKLDAMIDGVREACGTWLTIAEDSKVGSGWRNTIHQSHLQIISEL
jgi:serine/threonine-protein kinase HipA